MTEKGKTEKEKKRTQLHSHLWASLLLWLRITNLSPALDCERPNARLFILAFSCNILNHTVPTIPLGSKLSSKWDMYVVKWVALVEATE